MAGVNQALLRRRASCSRAVLRSSDTRLTKPLLGKACPEAPVVGAPGKHPALVSWHITSCTRRGARAWTDGRAGVVATTLTEFGAATRLGAPLYERRDVVPV